MQRQKNIAGPSEKLAEEESTRGTRLYLGIAVLLIIGLFLGIFIASRIDEAVRRNDQAFLLLVQVSFIGAVLLAWLRRKRRRK